MERVREYLKEHPEYVDMLEHIIEHEENNKNPESPWIDDEDYDSCWEFRDVGISPQKLYQLETNGVLERVADTNSTTKYSLRNREQIKELTENMQTGFNDDGNMEVMHEFPDLEEDIDGVFDKVIGYDNVKWLMKRAITSDEITNVILWGPPGSAKTVFLMCINEMGGSEYISAAESSGPGFIDEMFNSTPRFMCIDEIDDMDPKDQKNLSQYTETGLLKETKSGKNRAMETNTKTFATANSLDPILDQIQDRFVTLYFDKYTEEEFKEVCEHLLPREEGSTKEEAQKIAQLIWDKNQAGDIREAIQVARLSRGDPEKVIGVLDEYSNQRGSILG